MYSYVINIIILVRLFITHFWNRQVPHSQSDNWTYRYENIQCAAIYTVFLEKCTRACCASFRFRYTNYDSIELLCIFLRIAAVFNVHSIMVLMKFRTSANQTPWIWSHDQSELCNPRFCLIGDVVIVGCNLMSREIGAWNVIGKYTARRGGEFKNNSGQVLLCW